MGSGIDGDGRDTARRSAHARRHKHECPCGRVIWGNSWANHARACKAYLERYGWHFGAAEHQAMRDALWPIAQEAPQGQQSKTLLSLMHDERMAEARRRGLIS